MFTRIFTVLAFFLLCTNKANAVILMNNDNVNHNVTLISDEGDESFLIEASSSYEVCDACTIILDENDSKVSVSGEQTVVIEGGKLAVKDLFEEKESDFSKNP